MFGLGMSEIITLVIVVIVLINPKDLPSIARKIGKIYATVMKQVNGARKAFTDFEKDIKSAADLAAAEKETTKGELK